MSEMEAIEILDMIDGFMAIDDKSTAFSKIVALHAGLYIAVCEDGKMVAGEKITIILQILMEYELAFGLFCLKNDAEYESRISMVNQSIDEFRNSLMRGCGLYAFS